MRFDPNTDGAYPGWGDLMVVLIAFFASLLPAQLFVTYIKPADVGVFLGYIAHFGLAIAFVLWYMRMRGEPKPDIGLSLHGAVWGPAVWGFIAMAGASVVIEPLLLLFPKRYFDVLSEVSNLGVWVSVSAVALAPFCEEVLFRGLIQGPMAKRFGTRTAIVCSAVAFGLAHGVPPQAANAMVMGLILGYVYSRSGSIWPAVAIHLANNLISFIQSEASQGFVPVRDLFPDQRIYWAVFALAVVVSGLAIRKLATYPETVIGREQG